MNGLVAKAQKVPEGGWTMQDGTPWPGNNREDHPGMIQVDHSLESHITLVLMNMSTTDQIRVSIIVFCDVRCSWAKGQDDRI